MIKSYSPLKVSTLRNKIPFTVVNLKKNKMKEFTKFTYAEKFANELSAERKETISIVRRNTENNFIVCENGNDRNSHDVFVILISNFENRFKVTSHSPKSGRHTDYFATQKRMDEFLNEIRGYRTNLVSKFLTQNEYHKECVVPYIDSKRITETYLEKLRNEF